MKYFSKFIFLFKVFIFSYTVVLFSNGLCAQTAPAMVKGKLVDSISSAPLAFATVQVFNLQQKKLVNGSLVTETGEFSLDLPFGQYYAVLEFSGHPAFITTQFVLSAQNPNTILALYGSLLRQLYYKMW